MIVANGKARMRATKETMAEFVNFLANQVDRPVVDATHLAGEYSFSLYWVTQGAISRSAALAGESESHAVERDLAPDIFAALREQLGLDLVKDKGPVETIVIERIERMVTR